MSRLDKNLKSSRKNKLQSDALKDKLKFDKVINTNNKIMSKGDAMMSIGFTACIKFFGRFIILPKHPISTNFIYQNTRSQLGPI